jgi:hypothetical protein
MGLIQVAISNRGAESIVEHYTCVVEVDGKTLVGRRTYIPTQDLIDPITKRVIHLNQSEDL